MVNILDNLIPNIILSIALTIALYNLMKTDLKRSLYFPFTLMNFIIFYFTSVLNPSFALPVSFIFMAGSLYYCSKNIFYSLISVVFTYIILAISDITAGILIMSIFKYNNSVFIKENINAYVSLHLVILIISYTLSILLGKVISKLKIQNYSVKKYLKDNLGIGAYTLSTLVVIYVNSMIYKYFFYESNKLLVILNLIFIIIYFIMSIMMFYFTTKGIKKQVAFEYRIKELEQLKEYTDMLENVSNDLRKFRHDYTNILTSISGYIDARDIEGLNDYFNKEILPENGRINNRNKDLFTLQKVKVVGLKGLLSSKIIKAQSMNINTYIDITENIEKVMIDTIDLCRIMGILFDNAIEAASETNEKRIDFGIIQNEECMLFIILNSCNKDMPPIHKIYEKGFSTKGENRGLGLNIVKEIIDEKYSNILINTSLENEVFRQEVIIYKK